MSTLWSKMTTTMHCTEDTFKHEMVHFSMCQCIKLLRSILWALYDYKWQQQCIVLKKHLNMFMRLSTSQCARGRWSCTWRIQFKDYDVPMMMMMMKTNFVFACRLCYLLTQRFWTTFERRHQVKDRTNGPIL